MAYDSSFPETLRNGVNPAADGQNVTRINDISGNGRDLNGGNPIRQVGAFNGQDALYFDADELSTSFPLNALFASNAMDTATFAVLSQNGAKAANAVYMIGSDNNVAILTATWLDVIDYDAGSWNTARTSVSQPSGWDDAKHVLQAKRAGANSTIVVDNVLLTTKTNNSGSVSNTNLTFRFGRPTDANADFRGLIGCVWIFGATIGDFLAARIRHALMRKWRVNG